LLSYKILVSLEIAKLLTLFIRVLFLRVGHFVALCWMRWARCTLHFVRSLDRYLRILQRCEVSLRLDNNNNAMRAVFFFVLVYNLRMLPLYLRLYDVMY